MYICVKYCDTFEQLILMEIEGGIIVKQKFTKSVVLMKYRT